MKLSEKIGKEYANTFSSIGLCYLDRASLEMAVRFGFDAALEAVRAELAFMRNARNYINPPPMPFEKGVQAGLDYAKDRVEGMVDEELLGNPECEDK